MTAVSVRDVARGVALLAAAIRLKLTGPDCLEAPPAKPASDPLT
jgi:hypothetical protein